MVGENILLTIAGNKLDLERHRVVSRQEAIAYAETCGAHYCETSAKQGRGIDEVFSAMGKRLLQVRERRRAAVAHAQRRRRGPASHARTRAHRPAPATGASRQARFGRRGPTGQRPAACLVDGAHRRRASRRQVGRRLLLTRERGVRGPASLGNVACTCAGDGC